MKNVCLEILQFYFSPAEFKGKRGTRSVQVEFRDVILKTWSLKMTSAFELRG